MTDRPSEDDLIARYFAPLAGAAGLDLKDDAALMTPPTGSRPRAHRRCAGRGRPLFRRRSAGRDCAKSVAGEPLGPCGEGCAPLGFLLALALPPDWTADWLAAFAKGLGEDGKFYGCPLLGGDTVKTPGPLTLSITAFGAVRSGRMPARTGARPGDLLYVSGTIGDAALGLAIRLGRLKGLSEAHRDFLLDRYLLPRPRLALADAMSKYARGRHGCLRRLCRRPDQDAEGQRRDRRDRPHAFAAFASRAREIALDPALFEAAATGGDDYELIASVPPENAGAFEGAASAAGIDVTRIGEVMEGAAPPRFFRGGEAVNFAHGSFRHF